MKDLRVVGRAGANLRGTEQCGESRAVPPEIRTQIRATGAAENGPESKGQSGQAIATEKHLLTGPFRVRCGADRRPLAVTTMIDLVGCAECRLLVDRDAGVAGGPP